MVVILLILLHHLEIDINMLDLQPFWIGLHIDMLFIRLSDLSYHLVQSTWNIKILKLTTHCYHQYVSSSLRETSYILIQITFNLISISLNTKCNKPSNESRYCCLMFFNCLSPVLKSAAKTAPRFFFFFFNATLSIIPRTQHDLGVPPC